MNRTDLYRGMEAIDDEFLMEAEAAQPKREALVRSRSAGRGSFRAPRLFSPLAAALAALLLAGAVTAAVLLGPKITLKQTGVESFELLLGDGEAAVDAPGYLAQYYLPTSLPESAKLNGVQLSRGAYYDWTVRTAAGDGQIAFSQEPLPLHNGNEDTSIVTGEGLGKLEQGTMELDGTQYWTLNGTTAAGSIGIYYWKDPDSHYLMSAVFSETVPQAEREAFLRSVKPVEAKQAYAVMGICKEAAWSLGWLPEGFESQSFTLSVDGWGEAVVIQGHATDGHGEDIFLLQNFWGDLLDQMTKTEREIDGVPVEVYTRETEFDGETWLQETWRWFAPGSGIELQLTFLDRRREGAGFTEAEKLAVYRGLTVSTLEELDVAAYHQK